MFIRLLCICLALGSLACDGCGSQSPPPPAPTPSAPPAAAPTVLTGRVRLADGFELPRYARTDLERKVLANATRGAWPEQCTPPQVRDREPVQRSADGFLQGVMVAASEFKGAKPRPPRVHEVAIKDCRLTPALVVAVKGDSIRLTNEVDFPFMPTLGRTTLVRTLSPGQHFDIKLEKGDVQPVLCGFTAPCGRTDVLTMYHSVFAVTDEAGAFRIEDFPADQALQVHAWHPLFREAKLEVRVEKGQTKELEFVLHPDPKYAQGAAVAGAGDAGLPDSAVKAE